MFLTVSECPFNDSLDFHINGIIQYVTFRVWLGWINSSLGTQGLFEPSEHLWWVWGLILNAISPLLLSCWGFSAIGHGVSPHSLPSATQPLLQCLTQSNYKPCLWGHPRWAGQGGAFWQNVVPLEKGTANHFSIWEPHPHYERQKDRTLKDELPRWVDAQYAIGDQWRNNSRKNDKMKPKQKHHPTVDVTDDGSKVECYKD